jgi:hypothetical protein
MNAIRIHLMFWWHYGAKGSDRFYRGLLTSLAVLSFAAFLLEITHTTHVSSYLPNRTLQLHTCTNMKSLATALGISSAIMAGACVTFMGVLAQQSANASIPSLVALYPRALMSLSVAFLASFIATLTFGILLAITTESQASAQHWAVMFAALTLMFTSTLLLIFVLILLFPNKGRKRLGDEFGRVFSIAWLVFFGLMILMAQSAPHWGPGAGPALILAMCLTLLQIFYPHGQRRWKNGKSQYKSMIDSKRSRANTLFMLTILWTVVMLIAIIVSPGLCDAVLLGAVYILLILWSSGLLFLQIWVEGTRKQNRYPKYPQDLMAEQPRLSALLGIQGADSRTD